jgi:hypothetical protein
MNDQFVQHPARFLQPYLIANGLIQSTHSLHAIHAVHAVYAAPYTTKVLTTFGKENSGSKRQSFSLLSAVDANHLNLLSYITSTLK